MARSNPGIGTHIAANTATFAAAGATLGSGLLLPVIQAAFCVL